MCNVKFYKTNLIIRNKVTNVKKFNIKLSTTTVPRTPVPTKIKYNTNTT